VATLDLTPDDVLATTRAVRTRLDLGRPVEAQVLEECLRLAQQAPTSQNAQTGHFVVVTDPGLRRGLSELYNRDRTLATPRDPARRSDHERMMRSANFLRDHLHEVPVLVIPCVEWDTPEGSAAHGPGPWASIVQAAWSFMLAARARGLGTVWTTLHLRFEADAARLLGIPYPAVRQAALIPVGYTLGTDFRPAPRKPIDEFVHWGMW
jgi:nitroreductase